MNIAALNIVYSLLLQLLQNFSLFFDRIYLCNSYVEFRYFELLSVSILKCRNLTL